MHVQGRKASKVAVNNETENTFFSFKLLVEVKFIRTTKADWFDPDNWIHLGNDVKTSGQGSLLNAKTFPVSSLEAIPHVERVPCQYDSVTFPSNSSFNLKITMNVTIAKLFLGDKVIKKHAYGFLLVLSCNQYENMYNSFLLDICSDFL